MSAHQDEIAMAGPWITELEIEYVTDAMRNGWYGKKAYYYCEALESEFAAYHGRKHALMTPNCTTSIHLLLTALGIEDGDEVIAPECTWIASVAPVVYLRAKPVFCDIDPAHWCLDPKSIERKITPKTKAIIVVDLFGNMPDMISLQALADKHGIPLIEDSAEALGSLYNGKKAGSFGVASVFSFHRTKTMTTGEGGMLLIDDEKLFQRAKFLRDHGRVEGRPYYNSEVTYKYMPFNVQAALGYGQFKRLKELVDKKRWIFDQYEKRLGGVEGLQLNAHPAHVYNSYWTPAVVFDKKFGLEKHQIIAKLAELGVPSRPFFYPLSSLPAFPGYVQNEKENPVAYDISSRAINVACAMNLTEQQIEKICDGIKRIIR